MSKEKWAKAEANPGTKIPLGDSVLCDFCNKDWTGNLATGGFVVHGYATCPDCAEGTYKNLEKFDELAYIETTCEPGETFAQMVLRYRGPDAYIKFEPMK